MPRPIGVPATRPTAISTALMTSSKGTILTTSPNTSSSGADDLGDSRTCLAPDGPCTMAPTGADGFALRCLRACTFMGTLADEPAAAISNKTAKTLQFMAAPCYALQARFGISRAPCQYIRKLEVEW